MEVSNHWIEILILVSLVGTLGSVVAFAMLKKKSTQFEGGDEAFDVNENPLLEGSILEYSRFFLKADSGGFVVTEGGDLSIEFFKNKALSVAEDFVEKLEDDSAKFIKTNHGMIHKQHFVPKAKIS